MRYVIACWPGTPGCVANAIFPLLLEINNISINMFSCCFGRQSARVADADMGIQLHLDQPPVVTDAGVQVETDQLPEAGVQSPGAHVRELIEASMVGHPTFSQNELLDISALMKNTLDRASKALDYEHILFWGICFKQNDVNAEADVNRVSTIFQKGYGAHVYKTLWDGTEEHTPLTGFRMYVELCDFAKNNQLERGKTLLIVYYSGHGACANLGGLKFVCGPGFNGYVDFNWLFTALDTWPGPCAIILDCCFAGLAFKGANFASTVEVIAACAADQILPVGPFTSALCDILESSDQVYSSMTLSEIHGQLLQRLNRSPVYHLVKGTRRISLKPVARAKPPTQPKPEPLNTHVVVLVHFPRSFTPDELNEYFASIQSTSRVGVIEPIFAFDSNSTLAMLVLPNQVANLYLPLMHPSAVRLGFVNPNYVRLFPFEALKQAKDEQIEEGISESEPGSSSKK
jgi:hypothetical protein